ncbi:MAG: Siroheme synthase [Phycisphaerae bacterium]|nr:Siroheme synthase [Phycisphaerae bacterium]
MACDYPIFLDVSGRLAVVVGGGEVAARKVDKLLAAGARVRVVAPQVCDALAARSDAGLQIVREPFHPRYLAGALLVFACTDNLCVNGSVKTAAEDAAVPANIADDPDVCDFMVPAVHAAGPVKLAISTGGASPALAREIRKWLQANLPAGLGPLADELARARPIVQRRVPAEADRRALWDRLCAAESMELLAEQGRDAWRAWLEQLIAAGRQ